MFKRLAEGGGAVAITAGGKAASARTGDTVAAALLLAGIDHCRTTPVTGAPRAPYCLMGVCFDCLVTVAGAGGRQGHPLPPPHAITTQTQLHKREAGPSPPFAAARALSSRS